jgi:hypothetical protein
MDILELYPIKKYCDGLIDQGRFIGSDPVGHRCVEPPIVVDRYGHFICESCEKMLSTGRVTFAPVRYRVAELKTGQ